jgi:hypothetical protein
MIILAISSKKATRQRTTKVLHLRYSRAILLVEIHKNGATLDSARDLQRYKLSVSISRHPTLSLWALVSTQV